MAMGRQTPKVKYTPRKQGQRIKTYTVSLSMQQRAHWVKRARAQGISLSQYAQGLFKRDMEECASATEG